MCRTPRAHHPDVGSTATTTYGIEAPEYDWDDYGEVDLRRIRFIKTARRLDLSIDEIREILAFTDRSQTPCGHVREVVRRKTEELDDRIAEMIQLRDELAEIEKSVPVSIGPSETALCPLIEHRGRAG